MKKALACLLALTILLATLSGCNVPNSSTASSAPAASASSETQTPEAGTIPLREEIDDKYKWDLTQLFATNADFEAAMDEMIRLSEEVLSYKGKLDSPETILVALTSNSKCTQLKQTILVYSTCTYWSDMNDTANNEIYAQGAAAIEKAEKNVQNLSIELTALDQSVLESLIDDERFADYRDYLSIILKQKENALPAETQVILNDIQSAMSTYQDIYNTVTGTAQFPSVTDSEGNSVDVSLATLFPVLNSADRKVRQDGYHALYGGLNEASGEVIAQAYKGHIAKSYLEAKLKGYDSVLAMSTANDQVPMELYDTVINTVKDYKDVQARYYELTRQALGLEEMTAYDQMAPVLPEKVDIPYDKAAGIIQQAYQHLTPACSEIMNNAINGRRIDVYPNQGKYYNEMCIPAYGNGFYLVEIFDDSFNSLGGLAHELGHGLNASISESANPVETAMLPAFVNEVPSYTSEILTMNQLISSAQTPEEKIYYLREQLNSIQYYVLRRAMFADFEKQVYTMYENGEPLTNDSISTVYEQVFQEYYPTLKPTEDTRYVWQSIMHFYSPYYCYKYVTSYSAAAALVTRLESGEEGLAEKYEAFLAEGSNEDPLQLLESLGIDMSTGEPVKDLMEYYASLVDQYEQALKDAKMI